MAKNKYGEDLKRMPKEFWRSLISLEAFVGVVISPTKFADRTNELYKLVHFIYWVAPTPNMGFADAVDHLQRMIDDIPRPKRKALQRAARSKLHGLNRHQIRAVLYGSGQPTDNKKADFYKSWEWRTLRMEILQKQGRRCQCCGATSSDFDMHGNAVRMVVDHIKPISKFWERRLDPTNLQVLCDECNQGKGAWDQTDWRVADEEPLIGELLRQQLEPRH